MAEAAAIEIVHVGSACRDLATDDPRGWRLGGGVTYAALTTARLGLRTAAVDRRSTRRPRDATRARTCCAMPASRCSQSSLARGSGLPQRRDARGSASRPASRPALPLAVVDLPRRLARRPGLVVRAGRRRGPRRLGRRRSPMTPYRRRRLAGVPARRWRPASRCGEPRPGRRRCSARADLVGVSHHDVDPATSLADLARWLKPGADLLVTRGERGRAARPGRAPTGPAQVGALPADAAPARWTRPVPAIRSWPRSPRCPAAGHRRTVMRSRRPLDLRFAAAAGSLAVEAVGLAGVPDRAAVNVRRARERIRRAVVPTSSRRSATTRRGDRRAEPEPRRSGRRS